MAKTVKNKVRTSAKVATTASEIMRSNRYSDAAKSAAASALSNRRKKP